MNSGHHQHPQTCTVLNRHTIYMPTFSSDHLGFQLWFSCWHAKLFTIEPPRQPYLLLFLDRAVGVVLSGSQSLSLPQSCLLSLPLAQDEEWLQY